jgi:glutathionylspermidine synthase
MEGMGTSIELGGGSLETREMLGYGAEGFILQEYIELPQAFDYYYMVGSWVIDDTAAGIILRGDRQRITGRHCLIIPHIVAEDTLSFSL